MGALWSKKMGALGAENGLADRTGRDLVQHVYRSCFEAVGGKDELLIVMSIGSQSDALDGLPPVPSNFIVRDAVPQLEVLQRCSAFLTHGGANSVHEALSFGVPLAVVPVFGDQLTNCDKVGQGGAGLGFRQPLGSVRMETLSSALSQLAAESSDFRAAAIAMSKKIADAGGVEAAADAIIGIGSSSISALSLGGA